MQVLGTKLTLFWFFTTVNCKLLQVVRGNNVVCFAVTSFWRLEPITAGIKCVFRTFNATLFTSLLFFSFGAAAKESYYMLFLNALSRRLLSKEGSEKSLTAVAWNGSHRGACRKVMGDSSVALPGR